MARRMDSMFPWTLAAVVAVSLLAGGCSAKKPPVARPVQPPDTSSSVTPPAEPVAPAQPAPVREVPVAAAPTITEDPMASRSVDDLNRDSPFQPVFYDYDSADLTAEARAILDANAVILKTHSSWVITIEGHCDERGTAEYNLALGERRAVSAQSYLVSLGLPASRVRTVSYGKEFPFDPGHDEAAWRRNRRAHVVITGK